MQEQRKARPVQVARADAGGSGDLGEPAEESFEGGLAPVDGGAFVVGQRDGDEHSPQVGFGFEELRLGGVLLEVEVTACAGHAVLTPFEEAVGALAVPEVVVLPGLAARDCAGGDGVPADEDFDGPQVAGEVSGLGVALVGVFDVILAECWSGAVSEPCLQFEVNRSHSRLARYRAALAAGADPAAVTTNGSTTTDRPGKAQMLRGPRP